MPNGGKELPKQASRRASAGPRTVGWFLGGLSIVGAAVGYFAGLSDSPVVASLLPLLFGLIGGSSGFFLLTKGIGLPSSRYQLNVIGKSLIAFGLPCVLASAYGISIRTGASVSSFVPMWSDDAPSDVLGTGANSGVDLRLALLDAKLSRLGVSLADRKTIVRKAALETQGNVGEEYVHDMEQLRLKAAALLEVLEPIVDQGDERAEKRSSDEHGEKRPKAEYESHPVVDLLVSQLRLIALAVPQWVHPATNGTPFVVPRLVVAGYVTDLAATLNQFPGRPVANRRARPVETLPVYEWISRYAPAFDFSRLVDYERYVHALEAKYAASDWLGEKDLSEAIDDYIQATSTSEPVADGRKRPSIKP